VIVYVEEGPTLASLDDDPPTRLIEVPISDILKLMYEEAMAD
jgi:hypothetical protein